MVIPNVSQTTPTNTVGANKLPLTPPKLMTSEQSVRPRLLLKPKARRATRGFLFQLSPADAETVAVAPAPPCTPLYSFARPLDYLVLNAPKFPDVLSPAQGQEQPQIPRPTLTMKKRARYGSLPVAQAQAPVIGVQTIAPKVPLMSLDDLQETVDAASKIALPEIPHQSELAHASERRPIRRLRMRSMPAF
jgi:hypothetical protein